MTEPSRNRLRQAGLLRVVAHRSRSDWPLVLATWLLLACSTSLITSTAVYSESVTLGGFRQMLEATPATTTAVRVQATVQPAALDATDRTILSTILETLGPDTGRVATIVTTDGLSPAGVDASDASRQILVGSYGQIDAHASLVAGHWALVGQSPVQATLSAGAAAALGLSIGDLITLTAKLDPNHRIELEIVGLWQPDHDDPYWLDQGLELTGAQAIGSSVTRGPFAVTSPDLARMVGDVSLIVEWRWLPAIGSLRPDQADHLRAAIAGLPDRLAAASPGTYLAVQTSLPATLAAASRALLVTQSSVLLLFAQFAVLAGYAILLVAGLLVESRRSESALLRSRGATSGQLALLALGEAILLAVPAAAVAPFVAQAVVRALGAVGPLASAGVLAPVGIDGTAIAVAVAAAAGCVVALTIPALPGNRTLAGVRAALSRQGGRTLAQRLGLDLALVLVAAVAIWQLQLYGAPLTRTVRGDLGIDPLLVAAPAIGLLAGALVATRAVPRLGEIMERLLVRGSGLMASLLARQLGRRPLRYTRIALLLMLASALGTFGATFAATWTQSQSDQAAYEVGADERVTVSDYPALSGWALGPAYRAIPGVHTASAVVRKPFSVGRRAADGQLLAVDSAAATALVAFPQGTLSDSPASTMARLAGGPTAPTVPLPGQPSRLAVTIDTALLEVRAFVSPRFGPPETQVPRQTVVEVAVVLVGPDGLHRFVGGSATPSATNQRIEIDLTRSSGGSTYRPEYPLRLEAVELKVTGPMSAQIEGEIELRSVEAADAVSGGGWQAVDLVLGRAGWQWDRVESQVVSSYSPPAGRPGLVVIGQEKTMTHDISIEPPSLDGATLRYWAVPTGPAAIPALADRRFLEATGTELGDTLLVSRSGFESSIRVTGSVPGFPTLDPTRPFLVVDRAALELVDYAMWGRVDEPGEWWLGIDAGHDADVAATLRGGPYSVATVTSRIQLATAMETDPIALGVIGALGLGWIAAIAIATIGFLVTAAFMARERFRELALLRALGEGARGVAATLALEQVLLLIYGLVAGSALGLLLGWLAIPFASLTASGAAPVPPPVIVVPWQTIVPVGVGILMLLALAVLVLIGLATRFPLAVTLRAGDE